MRRNAETRARVRRAVTIPVVLAFALSLPTLVRAGGINLSWDDCGAAGTALKTFACDTNTGPALSMVASFVPPAHMPEFLGLNAELRLASAPGSLLPDWWRHGAGTCRGTTALSVGFDFEPGACADFWASRAVGGSLFELGQLGNAARLKVTCAVPIDDRGAIEPEHEYYGFRVRVVPSKAVSPGACAGCAEPVAVTLANIQLFQPPEQDYDPVLTTPLLRHRVFWQGEFSAMPRITRVDPDRGGPGTSVAIHGEHLDQALAVEFGGVPAPFGPSETHIDAVVPERARSGPIVVETPFGAVASPVPFHAAAVIDRFAPMNGLAGTEVTIRGHNFGDATSVAFGSLSAGFRVLSDSVLIATVPAGAEHGPIRIVNTGGTAQSEALFQVSAASGAVNLSWSECGLAGESARTFACENNQAPGHVLVGSFLAPPGVERLKMIYSTIRIQGAQLPPWWQLVACRGGALEATVRRTGACGDPWQGAPAHAAVLGYDVGAYGTGTARLRVATQIGTGSTTKVAPGREYYAFAAKIGNHASTGQWSCPGCHEPMALSLESVSLTHEGASVQLTEPLHRKTVDWQTPLGPGPEIHTIHPLAGAPGDTITITGIHLAPALEAWVGDAAAVILNGTGESVRIRVPAEARSGNVAVRTPSGRAVSREVFLVAPAITGFTPAQASAGQTVTVLGRNFSGATSVTFRNTAAAFQVRSQGEIEAQVPAGAGEGFIVVTTPAGSATSSTPFRWLGPPPEIHSFQPAAGSPGDTLTIAGIHLVPALEARIGDALATIADASDASLRIVVPAQARSGTVAVTTPSGRAVSREVFLVAPAITGFTPAQAPAGHAVTVMGRNFSGATAVTFQGVAAVFQVNSEAEIEARVPAGAVDGFIAVTTPAGTATSPSEFRVGPVPVGTINLSWRDCGAAGDELRVLACDAGAPATHSLFASFDPPPGVDQLVGVRGEIRVESGQLPDWWKVGGAAGCRGSTALTASFSFANDPATCADPWSGRASGTLSYALSHYGPNTARILVDGAMGAQHARAVVLGREYNAFRLDLRSSQPGEAGCFGCEVPVKLTLESLTLLQTATAGFHPKLTVARDRRTVRWQGEPGPPPTITRMSPEFGEHGSEVTLEGSGFEDVHHVLFDGLNADFYASGSIIVARVPAGARSGRFEVRGRFGRASSARFTLPPIVENFYPLRAEVGQTVQIQGANFLDATRVEFAGRVAAFQIVSDMVIQAQVPGVVHGPIRVVNRAGAGVSIASFQTGGAEASGAINLSWDDCGRAGAEVKHFACDAGTSAPHRLVASFRPPEGMNEFLGANATIEVDVDGDALPDWWRFGAGTCRGNALSAGFDFTSGFESCLDFNSGQAVGGFVYEPQVEPANRARIRITYAVPFDLRGRVDPAREYYAFQIRMTPPSAAATSACAGCEHAARLTLRDLQLFQPPHAAYDPVLTTPLERTTVRWQSGLVPSLGPNLAINPSFEHSTLGWRPILGATLGRATDAVDGEWSLEAVARTDTVGEFGINDSPNTVLATPDSARRYRFEGWLRSPTGGTRAQLRIREYADRTRLQTSSSSWLDLGGEWTRLSVDAVTRAPGSTLDFQVICHPGVPGAVVRLDRVSIRALGTLPSLTTPLQVAAAPGEPVEFEVVAVDPAGAPMRSLEADLADLPAGASFAETAPGRGVFRWVPQPEDGGGAYVARFRATSVLTVEAQTLVEVAEPAPDAFLRRYTFDTGLWNWAGYQGAGLALAAEGRTDRAALRIQAPDTMSTGFGANDSPNAIGDTGPTAGRRLRISAWVRSVGGARGRVHLKVREYLNRTLVGAVHYSPAVAWPEEWRQVVTEVVTGAAGSTLDLQIVGSRAEPGAAFLVDDVTIREIAPPSLARAAEATAALGGERDVAFERPVVFPTPYRDRATLAMTLPARGAVTVELFDLHGRRVKRIADRELDAGTHRFDLDRRGDDGERLGAGMYFYRVRGAVVANGRVVMLD